MNGSIQYIFDYYNYYICYKKNIENWTFFNVFKVILNLKKQKLFSNTNNGTCLSWYIFTLNKPKLIKFK